MDRLASYISLGDMPDQEEDDSDQETVSIQDLPEEALVGLTTITLECYDRPFVLKLFNELTFTPFRHLRIKNGILDGDLFTCFSQFQTICYSHENRMNTLDWEFPDRVNELLHKIVDAPALKKLEKINLHYVHRPTDSGEENYIPELQNLPQQIIYYAKLRDPSGDRPFGNIYCMSIILGEHNRIAFTFEKAKDEITIQILFIPRDHRALELTVVTLFDQIFHKIFGIERVFDYSFFYQLMQPFLDLKQYRIVIYELSFSRFMHEVMDPYIPPEEEDLRRFSFFHSFVNSIYLFEDPEGADDPQFLGFEETGEHPPALAAPILQDLEKSEFLKETCR